MRRPDSSYLPPITTDAADRRQISVLPQQLVAHPHHHLPTAAVVPPIVQPQYLVTTDTQSQGANNHSRTGLKLTIITDADGSRVSIAIIRLCDSVCLSVCPHDKPKRLAPKSLNLAQE